MEDAVDDEDANATELSALPVERSLGVAAEAAGCGTELSGEIDETAAGEDEDEDEEEGPAGIEWEAESSLEEVEETLLCRESSEAEAAVDGESGQVGADGGCWGDVHRSCAGFHR